MSPQPMVLAVAVPFAAAWLVTRRLLPTRSVSAAIERAGVALALAIGTTSIAFFLWRFAGAPVRIYPHAETTALLIVAGMCLYRWRPLTAPDRSEISTTEPIAFRSIAAGIMFVIAGSFARTVSERFIEIPHGEWDAWAMWNMRAAPGDTFQSLGGWIHTGARLGATRGLLPVLAVLVAFKLFLAPSSTFVAGMANHPLQRLTDLGRHQMVASYMATHVADWGGWNVSSPLWFVLGWLAAGLATWRTVSDAALTATLVVGVMLGSYFAVYVLTTQPMPWQMQVSWGRLVAQVWPTLVWSAAATGLSLRSSNP